ncbi:AI-2E family transporter [Aquibacillus salsiterrae]|uniref:AI-2E family transporter n=1 Tax=Aquibacillus salsiterrae TaxID=2950439 RepID=A0A9X3WBU4_9BACI|nr:AI-2E family transporter [Aquibacillus salsiterrae]MDC3416822.1 AI-2E family transporter [Aquibacillus salsiterrae]
MLEKKWFQVLIVTILVFLLILLVSFADFVFGPILAYLGAIAVPFVGAGVLYYITRPVVRMLETFKVPKILSIFIVFLLLIAVGYFVSTYIAPIVEQQFARIIDNVPLMIESAENVILYWQQNQALIPNQVEDMIQNFTSNLQQNVEGFSTFLFGFIANVFNVIFSIVLIPFFLFFMLKDDRKFIPFITQFFSKKKAESLRRLLGEISHTLAAFIQGQLIVSFFVGIALFIGYLIIGLNFSLTLAIFGMIMNVIPFIGPFLSVIPAIIVAVFQDPIMVVYVIIIMVIAQQLEGNIISPNIMGKALSLHPLTIITLILGAGSLAGILGLLFIIPTYAVIKTIIAHFYFEWKKNRKAEA